MSNNGNPNPTVVRTSRGLTVGGTRLTIYSLIDHFKAGDPDEMVLQWYPITAQQLADGSSLALDQNRPALLQVLSCVRIELCAA
jgi:uncharacterized protein (DUF433 family)